ncbi:malate dehydrogenase (quinone) [Corynebacterium jeikeium]|uniref:Probable malate:quinone oxidoreductase n=1 Tax=Corynebacterium jeikeium (strain K411) TaxID=306537 RepID=MQO_CORJK|nr:malate dehydrogenase (quinone) [Corynebacterium jeikeium]Q4JV42.1 RecName: Full=Probable malate:quinone oxidoreductase; AltName: Full=MQO; AltName: Full=Malate dehydrogenase [quinone] [Corynebacterium jeikeium K411]WCZ53701.1 Malate:quinone oxidoreductase [Corynebacterium jeikeium]CAI37315.1 malate:quinone-oxidoreductase [Corynebacterium jeikeium K411]SQI20728.1 malate:quinone oxidoreductase [Corynebacterium jeikeium]SUY80988.1 malate:quinone oxidoreductase [Corynebacterium jeikeium]SUY853
MAHKDSVDVALIGAGVISTTLSVMLKQLQPDWSQVIIERLDTPGAESSDPWNNAGTGHSALCELNYTPEVNGKIDISKAVGVNEKFQVSRQFWSYLVEQNVLGDPSEFINKVPHVSFAQGMDQVDYLKARYEALKDHPLFPNMQYSDSDEKFAEFLPLMARGRDFNNPVAISWFDEGTDINYGALTRQYLDAVTAQGVEVRFGNEVKNINRDGSKWKITTKNLHTGDTSMVTANFVFIGAGGMALPLLQKAGIPEIKGYGGFPVSGQWLRCTNPELVEQHQAKVYGKASVGAPPMSVPHLDTRVIDGKKGLLFGPYAGWTPKFLKKGSYLDLFKSLRVGNLPSYLGVGVQEMGLTKYLIEEVLKDQAARVESLREYMPEARAEDWELVTAGQRVQVIKPIGAPKFGSLEFGTALINSNDGSIAGLMGASPGASIAPSAMLEVLERCFGNRIADWAPKLREMIPSYGTRLSKDANLFNEQWDRSQKALKLV